MSAADEPRAVGEALDPALLRAFAQAEEPLPSGAFLARFRARLERQERRALRGRIVLALCVALLAGWLLAPLAASVSLLINGQALRALPALDALGLTPLCAGLLVLALGAALRRLRR